MRLRHLGTTFALLMAVFAAGRLQAQTTDVDRVDEDWELVLGTPSPAEAGPQITTTMSPMGDNALMFMSFNLNYRDDPFQPGGLQLRAWSGEQAQAQDAQKTNLLQTTGETITWTQRMRLVGGTLTYEIVAGESTTWGKFGQGELLDVIVPTSLTSLDGYRPAVTAERSGATWQSNRVGQMRLLRVRYYRGGSLVATDETARTIIPAAQ
jgi:hypothetical protein